MDFRAMISDHIVLQNIGARLELLRIKKGYPSYEAFAIANQLSRMQYWRIEKGKTNITIKSLVAILNIHDITIEEFFKIKVPKKGIQKPKTNANK